MAKEIETTLLVVRHGLTNEAKQGLPQTELSPLSDVGIDQAKAAATLLHQLGIHFRYLTSSPTLRAKQTAEPISRELTLPIHYDTNLREAEGIQDGIKPELLQDFKKRTLDFLEESRNREENNIVAVTHSFNIAMVCAIVVNGENFTPKDYLDLSRRFMSDNCGLTIFQYTENPGWQIKSWNIPCPVKRPNKALYQAKKAKQQLPQ